MFVRKTYGMSTTGLWAGEIVHTRVSDCDVRWWLVTYASVTVHRPETCKAVSVSKSLIDVDS